MAAVPLPSILIVDDDEALRRRLARAFNERGFQAVVASTVEEAISQANIQSPEYAVVDLRMGSQSGLDLVSQLKKLDPGTKIIVLSGYGSIPTALAAVKLGAVGFVQKPADADEILAAFGERDVREEGGKEPSGTPSLARAEWEHISRVLADCGGNISEAARRLGIHRRSLQRKLQKRPPAQ